jgi:AcrR family transcriptional regulator
MNDTPTSLLAATRRCIGRRGLAATTSRDIAAEAGANLASITYHFGSKDELVARALLDGLREWLAPALAVLGGAGDPAVRTVAGVQALLATYEAHADDAAAYLQALAHASQSPELRSGVVELWGELRGLLAADVRAMQEAGTVGAWADPDAMAAVIVAVANGLVLQVTVEPEGPSIEAMAAQFAALLLAARHPA